MKDQSKLLIKIIGFQNIFYTRGYFSSNVSDNVYKKGFPKMFLTKRNQ